MSAAESQPTVPKHGAKLRNIVLAIIAAFILLVLVTNPIVQSLHYHKTFPARHLEATQFIEAVYGYYADKGKWPDAATARPWLDSRPFARCCHQGGSAGLNSTLPCCHGFDKSLGLPKSLRC